MVLRQAVAAIFLSQAGNIEIYNTLVTGGETAAKKDLMLPE